MFLSIVSDELKVPPAEAFELISRWGLSHVELRGMGDGRIPEGDVQTIAALVKQHNLKVSGVSPGVFKCAPVEREIKDGLKRLDLTLTLLPLLQTDLVIVFPVQAKSEGNPSALVLEGLKEAGRIAAESDARIAIENEPGYTAVGARALAELIDAVGMDNVGANWDPGNAWPFDAELDNAVEILGDRIFNVHVKDTTKRRGERVFDSVGNGSIDWKHQIDSLKKHNYEGAVVVETHCRPGVKKSLDNVDTLRDWVM